MTILCSVRVLATSDICLVPSLTGELCSGDSHGALSHSVLSPCSTDFRAKGDDGGAPRGNPAAPELRALHVHTLHHDIADRPSQARR